MGGGGETAFGPFPQGVLMPATATESFNQEWFRRVWNHPEPGAIEELVDPDCRTHGLGHSVFKGPAEFVAIHSAFNAAFRGIQIEVLREVQNGDMIAAFCHVTMISRATGRIVTFHGCPMIRVQGHRIVEAWNTWDFLALVEAMGAAPQGSLERALAIKP